MKIIQLTLRRSLKMTLMPNRQYKRSRFWRQCCLSHKPMAPPRWTQTVVVVKLASFFLYKSHLVQKRRFDIAQIHSKTRSVHATAHMKPFCSYLSCISFDSMLRRSLIPNLGKSLRVALNIALHRSVKKTRAFASALIKI